MTKKPRKSRYPYCIFCRKNDSEPSKEDVFARWIAREWPGHKKAKFNTVGGRFGDDGKPMEHADIVEYGSVGNMGLLTHGPCKRCNNTWMSDLENAAKPIMKPMMHGVDSTLTTDQQLILTKWAVKTAIMYEYRESQLRPKERYFKPVDRLALFERRAIPDQTYLFIGHYIGSYALWTSNADIPLNIHFDGTRSDFPAYSFTFAVGHLAFQLFTFRWPVKSGATKINFALPGVYELATVAICPIRGNKHWPPEMQFDDPGFIEFSKTWRTFPAHEQRT